MRRTGASRELGVHPDTLLSLERKGLFVPPRDWNGHRRYTAEDIEVLRRLLYPGDLKQREQQDMPA